jgi:hypothetical protein
LQTILEIKEQGMTQERSLRFFSLAAAIAVGLTAWQTAARADTITLTTDDTGGSVNQTSFNTAGNWSNGSAPCAGNDYTVSSGHTLRTPASSTAAFVFAGDSLTFSGGALLKYKGGSGGTISVANFILNNGTVINGCASTTWTLAGNITLSSGGGYFQQSDNNGDGGRITVVSAAISGTGLATINGSPAAGSSTVGNSTKFTSKNTYSGGTSILSGATLYAETDGSLGTGKVTVSGTLILENGTTNNYIADAASLVVASGGSVNLNYSGTDVISGLTVNGVAYTTVGTYGGSDSGATNILSGFSGAGTLTLVPEPSTTVMMVSGVAGLLAFAWRKRRNRR